MDVKIFHLGEYIAGRRKIDIGFLLTHVANAQGAVGYEGLRASCRVAEFFQAIPSAERGFPMIRFSGKGDVDVCMAWLGLACVARVI